MNSNIESIIANCVNEHNKTTARFHGKCKCVNTHRANITDMFESFNFNEPNLLVIASKCSDCECIHEIAIAGVSCRTLQDPQIACESHLVHDSFNVTFTPAGNWNSLYCAPYFDGSDYKMHFNLTFIVTCRDCGARVGSFTIYINLVSEKSLLSASVIDKVKKSVLRMKDMVLHDYESQTDLHFPFDPEIDYDADSFYDVIGFPYKNIMRWFKQAILTTIELPQVSDHSFRYEPQDHNPEHFIQFRLEKNQ